MLKLAECTSPEAAALARDPKSVVLLPLGALEQHGPHLPLSVDWIGAEALADAIGPRLARSGWRPVLAPSVPYGVSPLAEEWSGTVSLSRSTLRRLVGEVLGALAGHGFRRFVLVNYQADPGHLRAMAAIKRDAERRAAVQVLFAGFTPGPPNPAMTSPRVTALLRSPRPDREWHAGELETAMMLAIRPRLVRREVARRLRPAWIDVHGALAAGARTFRAMHPEGRGYFGSPAAARAATGRAALRLRARLIARDLVRELSTWRRAHVNAPPARPRRSTRPSRRTDRPGLPGPPS